MKDIQVWSCGGGTQSGAIATLIGQGKLPRPDLAFMTDTGRERSSTWHFVDGFIRPILEKAGLELIIIKKNDWARVDLYSTQGTLLIPAYTNQSGTIGKWNGFCSGEWKRDVAARWLRSLKVESCVNWIGISIDEMKRVRTPRTNWLQLRYPLIFDVPMRRHQCVELIKSTGWTGDIPHSACYMCPNLGDQEWIDMKLNWPDDFKKAIEIEREIRSKDPNFFLHPSCIPLEDVDFFAQGSMIQESGCVGECFT